MVYELNTMNSLKRYPFVRLLIPLICGIGTKLFSPGLPAFTWYIIAAFFLFLTIYAFKKNSLKEFHYQWVYGAFLYVFLFCFGWNRTYDKQNFVKKDYFSNFDSTSAWIAYIEESPSKKTNSWKTTLTVRYVKDHEKWQSAKGSLIAYFAKDSTITLPQTNDCIIFFTPPDSIPSASNPYTFDYKKYLNNREINHRVYLNSNSWKLINEKAPFSLSRWALQLRSKILTILENSPLTEEEFGVASAILLGFDDRLDNELRKIYSNTGAAHILCVSGMHVGVVFLIINTMLAFLNRRKYGKILKAILLLLFIWSYAFITGLAPAVLRASIMISFVVFSNALNRPKETWNTIAASAFFLLIANPNLLIDVGFQLSYFAVIAIISLQPKISNLIHVPTWLGRNTWDLIAVSLAAQVGTAPLSILYFHQFPSWFILTNLIVMPVSTLIIYTGVGMLFLSFIPFLKTILGWLFFYEIHFLNLSMKWINNLPGAVIENINLLAYEAIIIYIAIVSFVIFTSTKTAKPVFVCLIATILFAISFTFKNYLHNSQNEITVFDGGKSSVVGFTKGRHLYLWTDSAFASNSSQQSFVTKSYQIRKGIRKTDFIINDNCFSDSLESLYINHNMLFYNNLRFVFFDQKEKKALHKFQSDYLFIRSSFYGEPEDFLSKIDSDNIVIDGSNSKKMINKWADIRDSLNENILILPKDGAFRINLSQRSNMFDL